MVKITFQESQYSWVLSQLCSGGGDKKIKTKIMIEKVELGPEEKLRLLYIERNRLYRKGCNDEKLNDKIRLLQQITNFKVLE